MKNKSFASLDQVSSIFNTSIRKVYNVFMVPLNFTFQPNNLNFHYLHLILFFKYKMTVFSAVIP